MIQLAKEKIGTRILGSWKLVNWVYETEAGEIVDFYGKDPHGLLVFLDSGYMSVHVYKNNRTKFNDLALNSGSIEEKANSFSTFTAYYGIYEEVRPGVFETAVEGALIPDWLGTTQIRYAELKDDILVLSTPPTPTSEGLRTFRLTWEKVDRG
ncbi:lipocalin-like domain-containing protein [Chondrinema litorale]|uniref:lipocalin-like domain-containing protein n=1 Tax=Chondrinema litorale TaxID=2994555 RepID=UPI0025427CC5|nr:lipocalin-like domain-containing protein [Chondrinema litorale]UZR98136.1 lipocalin-like domain-containing protein [Chondrinema litorale]